jgi:hypothetical protein
LICGLPSRIVSLPTRSIDAGTSNAGTSVRVAVTTTGASLTGDRPAWPARARRRAAPARRARPRHRSWRRPS